MIGFPPRFQALPPHWPRRRSAPVFARHGMVAAEHPLVTAAGLAELAGGGNAVDAAIAAAFVAGVVMPGLCGLGGDLFAVVHAPGAAAGQGETVAILGSGIAPRGASLAQMQEHGEGGDRMPYRGPFAIAVPGMVDACATLGERFATRPLARLLEPAIAYAGGGFPLTPAGAAMIRDNADLLRRYPTSAAVFLPAGRPPAVGSLFRQPDLARTLRAVATGGAEAFYRGEVARGIGQFVATAGGALRADDFADHLTVVEPPLTATFRGLAVQTTGLPSHGPILLEALNIAEQADFAAIGVTSATGVHLLAEAAKCALADRLAHARDPAFGATPLDLLLSKASAIRHFAGINPGRASADLPAADLQHADTTYLCTADGNGMMVSLISSISSLFGSGLVAGDSGVLLNNRAGRGFSLDPTHPNVFAPGKKTMHTLHCYLVSDSDGNPLLAGGTPGGDGQPQWNLETLVGLIDAGLDVQAATELPRWLVWPGTDPHTLPNPYELRVEDRIGEDVLYELLRRGHRLRRLDPWAGGGSVQLIARDPETGVLAGGSDPRAEGLALGL